MTIIAMERSTRQRSSIRTALEVAGRPLLPGEILAAAQDEVPSMGLATVYRNLKQLLDAGEITIVELPGEVPRYEMAGHRHHHHFRCDVCQRVFDIENCPGDMKQLLPPGFTVERHELTLYGRCSDCRAPARKRATGPRPPASGKG